MALASKVTFVEESRSAPKGGAERGPERGVERPPRWTADTLPPPDRQPPDWQPAGAGNVHHLANGGEMPAAQRSRRPDIWMDDFLRAAVEWLWEADADMRLTYVSQGISRSLGLVPAQLIGRRLDEIGRFLATTENRAATAEARLAARRPFRDRLFEARGAEGQSHYYRLSGVPVFDERWGRFIGYRGTGTSSTPPGPDAEAKAARALVGEIERLATAVTQLRLAEQLRGEPQTEPAGEPPVNRSEARLAHELRSPLNAIVGYAELVEQATLGPLPEKYRDYLQSIVTAARHLEAVVANFGARDEQAAEPEADERIVDLAQVMDEVRAIASAAAEKAGIDCAGLRLDDRWTVLGDHGALVQIFVNLAVNAVKFSRPGGRVGAFASAREGGRLAVTLWDEGIGIAADQLPYIFEPGYRVRCADAAETPGSGLGLSIVQDLVEAMQGAVEAESTPGQGTRITVILPLVETTAL